MIACENLLCVYYQHDQCLLDSIHLDVCGRCEDCLLIELSDGEIARARQRMRARLERRAGRNAREP